MALISPEALGGCLLDGIPIAFGDRVFGAAHVRVVDVRWYLGRPGDGRRAYDAGHIRGAVFLDVDSDLVGPTGPGRHPLPAPADFAARLSAAGIGDDDLVVAYDDVGGWVAARLWWMLDDLGHRAAAVLDGGIDGWIETHLPLTTEEPRLPATSLRLADRWQRVIDRDELRVRLGSVSLLDARVGERYRGETEPIDPVPGHIPTALSVPTTGNLGSDGRFLPASVLAHRFRSLGADRRPVVTSCGSGVAACHNALALRIAGLPDAILYDGSYSDWSTAGFPIATGPEPGEPPDR
jgi:thiosulfate/3-mercaptopyruvate sulfurtransferase